MDEIHSIGEEGGGIWEQVLLLNPAPLIGLSATIGAPEQFAAWLESVERSRGKAFKLIHHEHRFNALRKYVYAPRQIPNDHLPKDQKISSNEKGIVHFHPYAALAFGGHDVPSDLSLEAQDCLELVQLMTKVAGPAARQDLMPAQFFTEQGYLPHKPAIRIQQVIAYEKALRSELLSWRDSGNSKASQQYVEVLRALEKPVTDAFDNSEVIISETNRGPFGAGILPLLTELEQQGNLPAILFNFDRSGCEHMLQRCINDLAEAEAKWKATSPVWKT